MAGKKRLKSEHPSGARIIYRYSNRKMYDPAVSQYITASNLQQMLVEAEPFEVIGFGDGKNYTVHVLCTLLLNLTRRGLPIPHSDLRRIIQRAVVLHQDGIDLAALGQPEEAPASRAPAA